MISRNTVEWAPRENVETSSEETRILFHSNLISISLPVAGINRLRNRVSLWRIMESCGGLKHTSTKP